MKGVNMVALQYVQSDTSNDYEVTLLCSVQRPTTQTARSVGLGATYSTAMSSLGGARSIYIPLSGACYIRVINLFPAIFHDAPLHMSLQPSMSPKHRTSTRQSRTIVVSRI